MKKEVQMEYSNLLELLRNSEKKEEAILKEMKLISDDIDRMEQEAEKSPKY